jgi:hypothetical protein
MAKDRPDPNRLYVATESFITNDGSAAAGTTLLWGDDPLVRSHPQFFQESPGHARPEVEEATAAPGEKRAVKIPRAKPKARK